MVSVDVVGVSEVDECGVVLLLFQKNVPEPPVGKEISFVDVDGLIVTKNRLLEPVCGCEFVSSEAVCVTEVFV